MSYQIVFLWLFLSVTLCDLTDPTHDPLPTNGTDLNISSNTTLKVIENIPLINDKVELKVYYETLCPGSIHFFERKLGPAVVKLASYLDVQLIPYGHATTREINGEYIFQCQHGPEECLGNKLHACVIDTLPNNTQAVLLNVCLMDYPIYRDNYHMNYSSVLHVCGYDLNVNIDGIWDCVTTERGSSLLKKYGEDTHALRPPYVPYLVRNNSTDNQAQAKRNLVATICQMLQPSPPACHT